MLREVNCVPENSYAVNYPKLNSDLYYRGIKYVYFVTLPWQVHSC